VLPPAAPPFELATLEAPAEAAPPAFEPPLGFALPPELVLLVVPAPKAASELEQLAQAIMAIIEQTRCIVNFMNTSPDRFCVLCLIRNSNVLFRIPRPFTCLSGRAIALSVRISENNRTAVSGSIRTLSGA